MSLSSQTNTHDIRPVAVAMQTRLDRPTHPHGSPNRLERNREGNKMQKIRKAFGAPQMYSIMSESQTQIIWLSGPHYDLRFTPEDGTMKIPAPWTIGLQEGRRSLLRRREVFP